MHSKLSSNMSHKLNKLPHENVQKLNIGLNDKITDEIMVQLRASMKDVESKLISMINDMNETLREITDRVDKATNAITASKNYVSYMANRLVRVSLLLIQQSELDEFKKVFREDVDNRLINYI